MTDASIRSLPRRFAVEVLTPDQVTLVHRAALDILARTGVGTTSDRLLRLMADHGQDVDPKERRIRFAPDFVEAARARAPRTLFLAGRTPARDLVLDGTHGYLSPDGCAPQILDPATGLRRASTKTDLGDMTRLADALPEIGFTWRSVAATDQPAETHDLHEVEIQLHTTTKRCRRS